MDDRMLGGVTRKDAAQMKAGPKNVTRPDRLARSTRDRPNLLERSRITVLTDMNYGALN
jgi:hypothetical protein